MDKFLIEGGHTLKGHVQISGSKNAALPMMAACILAQGKVVLKNVPQLKDIETMALILNELGVEVTRKGNDLELQVVSEENCTARYELVSTMRASFCLLGPLIGKRKKAKISLPGGCIIGVRPVDLHVKGVLALGANVTTEGGYIVASADKLIGTEVYLAGAFGSTVTGTQNMIMASCLAEGVTIIDYAACEPEVEELCHFLNKMGAKISGIRSPKITIEGVRSLKGVEYDIIPDRIETGTFILAGAVTNSDITVKNIRLDHISCLMEVLSKIGIRLKANGSELRVLPRERLKATDITTLPYPGFPTDLQAQVMALLTISDGISVITEKIYPDRFMHVAELLRMGANIRKEGNISIVSGVQKLSSAQVMASDLRASAALVLAGLCAEGKTEINRVYHIDRGYEKIEEKLQQLGARIERA